MVAAARLRKSQQAILNARPFAQKLEEMMAEAQAYVHDAEGLEDMVAPVGDKRLLLVVTSDKGLCGAFNTNLIREAIKYIRQHGADKVQLAIVGRKGRDYFRRIGIPIFKEYVNVLANVRFTQAELITQDLIDAFATRQYVAVDLLYNEFKSVLQQKIVIKTLMPMIPPQRTRPLLWPEYIYEPDKKELLAAFRIRYLKAQVYRVLLESAAAELGARMNAMENATKNASELLSSFTLTMNRTRQATITNEILEVVSGAEALK